MSIKTQKGGEDPNLHKSSRAIDGKSVGILNSLVQSLMALAKHLEELVQLIQASESLEGVLGSNGPVDSEEVEWEAYQRDGPDEPDDWDSRGEF